MTKKNLERKKLAWAKNLKDKKNPNDNKKTPLELAKKLIDMTPFYDDDVVLDGFAGEGAFINQYPQYIYPEWCEINYNRDFFKWKKMVDWVGPTNPPYSKINKVFEHSVKIAKKGIAYLIGIINITPKRLQFLDDNNFGITHFHICQVRGWFGKSVFIIAQKNKKNIISYSTKSFQMPQDEYKIFKQKEVEYQKKYYKKNFSEKLKKYRRSQKNG